MLPRRWILNELNKKIEAIGYNMQRIPEIILYEDRRNFYLI